MKEEVGQARSSVRRRSVAGLAAIALSAVAFLPSSAAQAQAPSSAPQEQAPSSAAQEQAPSSAAQAQGVSAGTFRKYYGGYQGCPAGKFSQLYFTANTGGVAWQIGVNQDATDPGSFDPLTYRMWGYVNSGLRRPYWYIGWTGKIILEFRCVTYS